VISNSASKRQAESQFKIRRQPSSRFPIKFLSPDSQKGQTQLERKRDKKQLKKYECVEVSRDEQHEDMCEIVDKISKNGYCLNDLFAEGDELGVGQVMDLWERKVKEEFEKDQKTNSVC
jgi:hypothetical protein